MKISSRPREKGVSLLRMLRNENRAANCHPKVLTIIEDYRDRWIYIIIMVKEKNRTRFESWRVQKKSVTVNLKVWKLDKMLERSDRRCGLEKSEKISIHRLFDENKNLVTLGRVRTRVYFYIFSSRQFILFFFQENLTRWRHFIELILSNYLFFNELFQ